MKKLTIDEMQKRLDKNNPFYSVILNDDLHHTHVLCGKCKQEYTTSYHTILKSKFKVCLNCAKMLKSTKLSKVEDIKNEVESYGFIPLFDVYEGCHKLFPVQDNEGYKGTLSLVSMRRGAKISRFAKYNVFALENVRKYCIDNNIDCVIPEQKYQGWDCPIEVICSCGKHYKTTLSHFINDNQHQCLNCSGSKSQNEKVIEEWLRGHGVNFIAQYKFEDCVYRKQLSFDFYLSDYCCCIEVDGEGHEKPTRFNGISLEKAQKLFDNTRKRDNIKTIYCQEHNIDLYRISYHDINTGNYKNILTSIIQ